MANIVNNILNKVDMNTTKYNKKLQDMKKNTKSTTRSITDSLASIGSSWKSIVATIASGAFVKALSDSQLELEKSVASMSGIAGGIENSRALFEMLQQSARDTLEPFDSLQRSAIALGKVGIDPSAEAMKGLKQIALSTGQSMETTANAFSQVMLGKYRSLNQLGITAEDTGNTLKLTYKGVTQEIEKNNEALSKYIVDLGSANSEPLDYLQGGMSGALNKLDNAWGDFVRAIAESGFGEMITEVISEIGDAIDWLTNQLKTNDAFITFATSAKDTLSEIIEGFKSLFGGINELSSESETDFSNYLGNIVNLVKIGLVGAINYFVAFFNGITEMLKRYYENCKNVFTNIMNLDFSNIGFGSLFDGMGDAFTSEIAIATRATDMYTKDLMDKSKKNVADAKKRIESINADFKKQNGVISIGTDSSGKSSSSKVKDESSKMLSEWKRYYANLEDIYNQHTMTALERAKLEHDNQLAELENFHAQGLVSEEEYQKALSAINMQYADEWHRYQDELLKMSVENAKKKNKNLNALGVNEEDFNNTVNGLQSMSDAFANLTDAMNENSSEYKVVFAMQKAFSVASTTMNCINAWAKALGTSTTWYESIANYASAIAMTTQIISQIKSVSMYDKGGNIPSGAIGIVGEYGPEIVRGPANVTSRKDTEELLSNANSNVVININESNEKAGTVEQSQDNEQTIIDIFVSNIRGGGQISNALQNTYGLKRYGV